MKAVSRGERFTPRPGRGCAIIPTCLRAPVPGFHPAYTPQGRPQHGCTIHILLWLAAPPPPPRTSGRTMTACLLHSPMCSTRCPAMAEGGELLLSKGRCVPSRRNGHHVFWLKQSLPPPTPDDGTTISSVSPPLSNTGTRYEEEFETHKMPRVPLHHGYLVYPRRLQVALGVGQEAAAEQQVAK